MEYTDLQINGCYGVDFNSNALSFSDFAQCSKKLKQSNTHQFLATVITDEVTLMCSRIQRIVEHIDQATNLDDDIATCVGIHVEGPFLSPHAGYIGAHPKQYARPADLDVMMRLLDAGAGHIRLVTLAPEQDCHGNLTRFLSEQGIIVSAGHTNASVDELRVCIDNGLVMITHFGNACPSELPRHDNILWRMMSVSQGLYVGLIPDGHHLPLWMLLVLIDYFGLDRICCVSDAMSAAGLGPGIYNLGHRSVVVGEDLVARDAEHRHFVGSTSLLQVCHQNLKSLERFSDVELGKLLNRNARDLLSNAKRK